MVSEVSSQTKELDFDHDQGEAAQRRMPRDKGAPLDIAFRAFQAACLTIADTTHYLVERSIRSMMTLHVLIATALAAAAVLAATASPEASAPAGPAGPASGAMPPGHVTFFA